jgi:hypothetical protein
LNVGAREHPAVDSMVAPHATIAGSQSLPGFANACHLVFFLWCFRIE